MRVLGFCPTYRVEPETVAALIAQEWHGAYDVLFTRDNPHPSDDRGRANILHNYQKGRRAFLDGGYDALFIVESDILPPSDALEKLAACDSDLAYGLYLFRNHEPLGSFTCNVYRYTGGPYPDQPLTTFFDEYREAWGKVIPCSGSGLGCVLIQREVLVSTDFRGSNAHCDTAFTDDVWRAGYSMKADMSVVCGHKFPSGAVVWPAPEPMQETTTQGTVTGYRGITDSDPVHPGALA